MPIVVSTDQRFIGEVHCLNCDRLLAEIIRNPENGKLALQPSLNQSAVQVVVAGRRLLRCHRCGNRAFIDLREGASPGIR